MGPRLLLLELNEVNFSFIQAYSADGKLPNFLELINIHGTTETSSERNYEELEPWVQWVTAHTGLTLAQHSVFRLGDIVQRDISQIWEVLEDQGLKIGAVSPMNAKNRCRHPAFFVPDPWTPTSVSAGGLLTQLYNAIAQAVNDNAEARVTVRSAISLLTGAAAFARPINYLKYVTLASAAGAKPWSKAMFLDLLLTDVFVCETKRKSPDFASLFINAGAHIQHHYLFNSAVYGGKLKNPEWYLSDGVDPVLEVYQLYDRIVGQLRRAFPETRLMIATGLHQDPHPEVTYYWRLRDHAAFLKKVGVPFERVEPRMSRDFLIVCSNREDAERGEHLLASAESEDGIPLFDIDNRGTDLFVMLTFPHDIDGEFVYTVGNERHEGLRNDVAFVAIKNGQHNGMGYFIDTGVGRSDALLQFPLKDLPLRICEAVGAKWHS